MAKEKAFHIRMDATLKDAIDAMCDEVGIEPPAVMRAAMKAVLKFHQENGYINLPLEVIPKSAAKTREDKPGQRPRRRERPSGPTTAQPPRQSAA